MAMGADVNAKDVSGRGRGPWPRMGWQAAGQKHVRQQATPRGCGIVTEAAGGQATKGQAVGKGAGGRAGAWSRGKGAGGRERGRAGDFSLLFREGPRWRAPKFESGLSR